MARVALYLRVSTSGQTVENQRRELELWAARAGHEIVATYEDNGVSGAKGREARPGLDQALKDATRRRYDVLAVWSVDRLGRSLQHVVHAMQELRGAGVGLFLHQQALDTTTPAGKAMFGMLAVFGELEREIIRERVNSGLARARAQGARLGRPGCREPSRSASGSCGRAAPGSRRSRGSLAWAWARCSAWLTRGGLRARLEAANVTGKKLGHVASLVPGAGRERASAAEVMRC
jgi:DNA invertase Pin-like site-specific DNA recombinase